MEAPARPTREAADRPALEEQEPMRLAGLFDSTNLSASPAGGKPGALVRERGAEGGSRSYSLWEGAAPTAFALRPAAARRWRVAHSARRRASCAAAGRLFRAPF